MINVLIADDDPLVRGSMRALLEAEADIELIGESANGKEAVEDIRRLGPDLVFLDVEMPQMDGISVVKELDAERMPSVIFVTAHQEYAVGAFELHALDYLLKPFGKERFREALQRGRQRIASRDTIEQARRFVSLLHELPSPNAIGGQPLRHPDRFLVKADGREIFVRTADIRWMEAAGNYVRLHTAEGVHLIRDTMTSLAERLNPDRFVRIHRSTIVNLDEIAELRPIAAGDFYVTLQDGSELKLSRNFRENLEQHFRLTG